MVGMTRKPKLWISKNKYVAVLPDCMTVMAVKANGEEYCCAVFGMKPPKAKETVK